MKDQEDLFDEQLELEAEALEIASRLPLPEGSPPGFLKWVLSIATDIETEGEG